MAVSLAPQFLFEEIWHSINLRLNKFQMMCGTVRPQELEGTELKLCVCACVCVCITDSKMNTEIRNQLNIYSLSYEIGKSKSKIFISAVSEWMWAAYAGRLSLEQACSAPTTKLLLLPPPLKAFFHNPSLTPRPSSVGASKNAESFAASSPSVVWTSVCSWSGGSGDRVTQTVGVSLPSVLFCLCASEFCSPLHSKCTFLFYSPPGHPLCTFYLVDKPYSSGSVLLLSFCILLLYLTVFFSGFIPYTP
jgi:hypothetical protein